MLIFVVIGEYHRVSPHISTKDDDPGVSSMPDSMSSTTGAVGCFPVVAAGSSNAGSVDGGSSGSSSMITRSSGKSFGRGMRGRGSVRGSGRHGRGRRRGSVRMQQHKRWQG